MTSDANKGNYFEDEGLVTDSLEDVVVEGSSGSEEEPYISQRSPGSYPTEPYKSSKRLRPSPGTPSPAPACKVALYSVDMGDIDTGRAADAIKNLHHAPTSKPLQLAPLRLKAREIMKGIFNCNNAQADSECASLAFSMAYYGFGGNDLSNIQYQSTFTRTVEVNGQQVQIATDSKVTIPLLMAQTFVHDSNRLIDDRLITDALTAKRFCCAFSPVVLEVSMERGDDLALPVNSKKFGVPQIYGFIGFEYTLDANNSLEACGAWLGAAIATPGARDTVNKLYHFTIGAGTATVREWNTLFNSKVCPEVVRKAITDKRQNPARQKKVIPVQ